MVFVRAGLIVAGAIAVECFLPVLQLEKARAPAVIDEPEVEPEPEPLPEAPPPPPPPIPRDRILLILERARQEVERGVRYDAHYRKIRYPGGDVPLDVGACSDLVVRALRAADIDLQVEISFDAIRSPESYPFGSVSDVNIDHRRVPTLFAYFEHHADVLAINPYDAADFLPGDLVFYGEPRLPPRHVAMVSDRIGPRGLPLVLQNGGPKAMESDALDQRTMIGHFRLRR